jgi:hypothetical protein
MISMRRPLSQRNDECNGYNEKLLGRNRRRKYARLIGNEKDGEPMADETQKQTVSLEELMVSTLAMADATVKFLI